MVYSIVIHTCIMVCMCMYRRVHPKQSLSGRTSYPSNPTDLFSLIKLRIKMIFTINLLINTQ